jgi:uncharacterized protein YcfJ
LNEEKLGALHPAFLLLVDTKKFSLGVKKMKSIKTVLALSVLSLAAVAASASAETFTDVAQVVSSQPVFAQGNCAGSSSQGGTNLLGTAIGGVAGGLLGNQVGGGNGRTAATAVGAVVGALTGNNLAGSSRQAAGDCGQRLVGHAVTYEYAGRRYTSQFAQLPGATIPVQVDRQISVRPLIQ